jgi:hypothetical protein
MKKTFKQQFWKIARWFAIIFLFMFTARLLYGYALPGISGNSYYSDNFFSSIDNLRKNYASEKSFIKTDIAKQADFASSEKYEKIATVKSKSSAFDKDAATVRSVTKDFEGIVQYEQNTGSKGSRDMHLLIGKLQ